MKNIAVKIGASNHEPIDLAIEPGTSSEEIFDHIKEKKDIDLSGYGLSREDGKNQFARKENVYPEVEDGDKLYAFKVSKVA